VAFGVLLALAAADFAAGVERRWDRRRALAAALGLASLAAVVVTGILVTAAGPHSGDPKVVRRIGSLSAAAAVHVRAVIAFAAVGLVVAVVAARRGWLGRATRRLALVMIPAIALQVGIGEYQYRHHLPWEVVGIHVTVAGCLWALGVAIAALLARPAEPAVAATAGTDADRGHREPPASGAGARPLPAPGTGSRAPARRRGPGRGPGTGGCSSRRAARPPPRPRRAPDPCGRRSRRPTRRRPRAGGRSSLPAGCHGRPASARRRPRS